VVSILLFIFAKCLPLRRVRLHPDVRHHGQDPRFPSSYFARRPRRPNYTDGPNLAISAYRDKHRAPVNCGVATVISASWLSVRVAKLPFDSLFRPSALLVRCRRIDSRDSGSSSSHVRRVLLSLGVSSYPSGGSTVSESTSPSSLPASRARPCSINRSNSPIVETCTGGGPSAPSGAGARVGGAVAGDGSADSRSSRTYSSTSSACSGRASSSPSIEDCANVTDAEAVRNNPAIRSHFMGFSRT
jgi:hypothetical protein